MSVIGYSSLANQPPLLLDIVLVPDVSRKSINCGSVIRMDDGILSSPIRSRATVSLDSIACNLASFQRLPTLSDIRNPQPLHTSFMDTSWPKHGADLSS
jgi:hypothetical protein